MEAHETAAFPSAFPLLNQPAPDFEAVTTHGPKKLSEYRGKWLVLFSHPADFTPVCTTEFVGFARHHDEFRKLGCELLGLSIDSVHSHLAWVRNIREKFGVEIQFPIIADLKMEIAKKYGMIHPAAADTSAVRATFFIDPDGILRALAYYPITTGRSIPEFVRMLQALQTHDRHGVATPEGWQPGDDVIVPAPTTAEAADRRLEEGFDCVDWYLCTRKVSADGKLAPPSRATKRPRPRAHAG